MSLAAFFFLSSFPVAWYFCLYERNFLDLKKVRRYEYIHSLPLLVRTPCVYVNSYMVLRGFIYTGSASDVRCVLFWWYADQNKEPPLGYIWILDTTAGRVSGSFAIVVLSGSWRYGRWGQTVLQIRTIFVQACFTSLSALSLLLALVGIALPCCRGGSAKKP